jgi:uncharacterized protein (DUF302 family)
LVLASPSAAIDLPLKFLVSQDAAGVVSISYNSTAYLRERHDIPSQLMQSLAVVEGLAAAAAE